MPPVEREPGVAERSGELIELGKSDTELSDTELNSEFRIDGMTRNPEH